MRAGRDNPTSKVSGCNNQSNFSLGLTIAATPVRQHMDNLEYSTFMLMLSKEKDPPLK